jgi:hypothetical protein
MPERASEIALTRQEKTEVPEAFGTFIDGALTRLAYLYPGVRFERDGLTILWSMDGEAGRAEEVRRDIFFQLYRERIYAETLEVRKRIYDVR